MTVASGILSPIPGVSGLVDAICRDLHFVTNGSIPLPAELGRSLGGGDLEIGAPTPRRIGYAIAWSAAVL